MKLSDAFECPMQDPELELKCRVYNINFGKNTELTDKCQVLRKYMIFVNRVRQFLTERRLEVAKMVQLDYTFERQIMLEREAALAEGIERGTSKGYSQGISQGISQSIISILEEKGEIPDELEAKIKAENNAEKLNTWRKTAGASANVSEFREKIGL